MKENKLTFRHMLGYTLGDFGGVALLGVIGYDAVLANQGLMQSSETLLGIKVLCLLTPALAALGSWAAFRFVWYMEPETSD